MPNPTSSRAKHAAALTGQPPQPRGSGGRSQHAAVLTGVPPRLSAHPRAQLAAGGRHPAQDQAVVQGSVLLTSVNQVHAVLQGAETGHGPANRVKAAHSMIGIPYLQQTGTTLRAGITPEAMKYMDCSEFVSRVLAIDGITQGILPMNTGAIKALLSQKDKFANSKDTPRVGDIALWDGHVGIVTGVGRGNTVKLTHASGKGRLSSENPTAIKPSQYRSGTFYGYYRPIQEAQQGYAGGVVNTPPAVFTRPAPQSTWPRPPAVSKKPTQAQMGAYRSDADGTFPLEEVIVRSSPDSTRWDSPGLPSPTVPRLNVPPTQVPPNVLPSK